MAYFVGSVGEGRVLNVYVNLIEHRVFMYACSVVAYGCILHIEMLQIRSEMLVVCGDDDDDGAGAAASNVGLWINSTFIHLMLLRSCFFLDAPVPLNICASPVLQRKIL